jgi:hypothetical protein
MGTRHEETIGRTHNYADTKKGVPRSDGTTLGVNNRGHCMGRGSQDIYGIDPGRVCKVYQQQNCSTNIGRT